jgi:hypothetical protein
MFIIIIIITVRLATLRQDLDSTLLLVDALPTGVEYEKPTTALQ